jgi:PsbP
MKLILTLIFFASTYCGYSQTDTSNQLTNFTKENYKLQYPKSWTLDTSGIMGTELFVFSPLENESDKFKENVNVIIQNLKGQNIDLDKYKQITDAQIANMAADIKVFVSSKIKTEKGEFYKIIYAMTQGNFRLKISSYCYIKNEKAYLVTFTSEFDKYEQYKKVGEKILTSFSLTK